MFQVISPPTTQCSSLSSMPTATTNLGHHKSTDVVADLLYNYIYPALQSPDYNDVSIRTASNVSVPACRFVLALRSPVLKCMLYGSYYNQKQYRFSSDATVDLTMYSERIVQAVVEFCRTNTVQALLVDDYDYNATNGSSNTLTVTQIVQLAACADYLQLPQELMHLITRRLLTIMSLQPKTACIVYNESDNIPLQNRAMQVIQTRPYAALGDGGLRHVTKPDRLLSIYKNQSIAASEFFLYTCLQKWYEDASCIRNISLCRSNSYDNDEDIDEYNDNDVIAIASDVAEHINLEFIDPQRLLNAVQHAPFVQKRRVFAALAEQALKASTTKQQQDSIMTTLQQRQQCRCSSGTNAKVLVEGAGVCDVNGLYYWIASLSQGNLYAKREVSCGQAYVYTLLSSTSKDAVQCRIFASHVLTQDAVKTLLQNKSPYLARTSAPSFMPVMQIVGQPEYVTDTHVTTTTTTGIDTIVDGTNKDKNIAVSIILSDGDSAIPALIAAPLYNKLLTSGRSVSEFGIIKIVAYQWHERQNDHALRITNATIVHETTGCQFRHSSNQPLELLDVNMSMEDLDDDVSFTLSTSSFSKSHMPLYSCQYRGGGVDNDGGSGWKIEKHGQSPAPQCWWVPPSSSIGNAHKLSNVDRKKKKSSVEEVVPSSSSTTITTTTSDDAAETLLSLPRTSEPSRRVTAV